MHEPPFGNRSVIKADRTPASPISEKKRGSVPRVYWTLLLLYPSFSGAVTGRFQPEQPWDKRLTGNPLSYRLTELGQASARSNSEEL